MSAVGAKVITAVGVAPERKAEGTARECADHVDFSSGTRMASARGTTTRKRSFAARGPLQFQLSGFLACNRAKPDGQRHGPSYKLREDGIVPLICPTCQNVFAGKTSGQATPATLHGVVFDILVGARVPRRPCGFARRRAR